MSNFDKRYVAALLALVVAIQFIIAIVQLHHTNLAVKMLKAGTDSCVVLK